MIACPKCASAHVTGHEVPGVYDGVLFWSCDTCHWHWGRSPRAWPDGSYREQVASQMVAHYNTALYRPPPA